MPSEFKKKKRAMHNYRVREISEEFDLVSKKELIHFQATLTNGCAEFTGVIHNFPKFEVTT